MTHFIYFYANAFKLSVVMVRVVAPDIQHDDKIETLSKTFMFGRVPTFKTIMLIVVSLNVVRLKCC